MVDNANSDGVSMVDRQAVGVSGKKERPAVWQCAKCFGYFTSTVDVCPYCDPNKPDLINHPPHYQTMTRQQVEAALEDHNGIEASDIMDALADKVAQRYTGAAVVQNNAVMKYMLRWMAKHDDGTIDIKKAQWHLKRLLQIVGGA